MGSFGRKIERGQNRFSAASSIDEVARLEMTKAGAEPAGASANRHRRRHQAAVLRRAFWQVQQHPTQANPKGEVVEAVVRTRLQFPRSRAALQAVLLDAGRAYVPAPPAAEKATLPPDLRVWVVEAFRRVQGEVPRDNRAAAARALQLVSEQAVDAYARVYELPSWGEVGWTLSTKWVAAPGQPPTLVVHAVDEKGSARELVELDALLWTTSGKERPTVAA